MIIKDLIELCPVEEIVSEILLMCGVDENERVPAYLRVRFVRQAHSP